MGQQSGWTLGELGEKLGATVRGPSDLVILRPVPAGSSDPSGITFAETSTYLELALATSVGAVIVGIDVPQFDKPALLVPSPRMAFFRLLAIAEKPIDLPRRAVVLARAARHVGKAHRTGHQVGLLQVLAVVLGHV